MTAVLPSPSTTRFELNAHLASFGAEPMDATVTIVLRPRAERVRRALMAFGACMGCAAVGLFIPLAHFFLVPGFTIAGVALGVTRLREDRSLVRVHGVCPACRAAIDIAPGGVIRDARELRCPACARTLTLTIDAASWPVEPRG